MVRTLAETSGFFYFHRLGFEPYPMEIKKADSRNLPLSVAKTGVEC